MFALHKVSVVVVSTTGNDLFHYCIEDVSACQQLNFSCLTSSLSSAIVNSGLGSLVAFNNPENNDCRNTKL